MNAAIKTNNVQEIINIFKMLHKEEQKSILDIMEKISRGLKETEEIKMDTNIIKDVKNLTIAEVYPSALEDIKTAEEEDRKAFKAIKRLTFYDPQYMVWHVREFYENAEPTGTPTREEAEIIYQRLFKAAGYRNVAEIKSLAKAKADEYVGGNLVVEINRRQKTTYTCIPRERVEGGFSYVFSKVRGNKRLYTC